MTDLTMFHSEYPVKRQLGYFTEEELATLKNKLPGEVIEFLRKEGKCTFGNDLLWTVLPDAYYEMMEGWGLEKQGLDPKKCHAIFRSSFGTIVYWHENKYYFFVSFTGFNSTLGKSFDITFNYQLTTGDLLKPHFLLELHEKAVAEMPQLQEDEMYAIDPPIEKAKSVWTSQIVIVKMKEYFIYLAKLYKHNVKKDITQQQYNKISYKPKPTPRTESTKQQPGQTFKDVNLKFGIIAILNRMGLYLDEAQALREEEELTDKYEDGDYDYMLPKVVKYYKKLYIQQEDLDKIVSFYAFGDCYSLMMKEWDGEDDVYNIKSLEGIEILRKMEVFEFFMMDNEVYQDITPLLRCPALKKVKFDGPAYRVSADHVKQVFDQLREKGVEIELRTF